MLPADPQNRSQKAVWMEDIRPGLRDYCLSLTRHAWEADDLVQETMIRLLGVTEHDPEKVLSKSYAFRIARNLWIDQCRKRERSALTLLDDSLYEHAANPDPAFNTQEMLDSIARLLNPKSVVILLLMDVFDFTAKETARMIASTEGAVQVALSRARSRLRELTVTVRGNESNERAAGSAPDPAWFEAILEGFRRRDPKAIYTAYLRLSEGGVRIRDLRSAGGRLFFTFQDPNGNLLLVST